MKKRVKMCDFWQVPMVQCSNVLRETRMYVVDYTGPVQPSHLIPPVEVAEKRMRVCPDCYRACGYVAGRKRKRVKMDLEQVDAELERLDRVDAQLERAESIQVVEQEFLANA